MSISPLATPFQQLGARRFSFFPPILNVRHNEWVCRRATWTELVAINTESGEEVCIPRIFVGEVSIVDHPVVIVGLTRELEWREGAIYPHRRAVIELPVAVNDVRPSAPRGGIAPVVSIRLEPRPRVRTRKKLAVAMVLAALLFLVLAESVRQFLMR